MNTPQALAAAALLGLGSAGAVWGQNAPQPPTIQPQPLQNVEQTRRIIVTEDAGSRIEEQRLGGQTERITVQPKNNAPAYEVLPENPSRNPGAQGPARRGGGERVWNIFSF